VRLSVLLPCRNAGAHLGEAIASIEAQSFGDFEVVAVDDGSVDDTAALLDAWRRRDPRVRLIRTGPNGLVAALNTALHAADGELVARMDADDVAWPARFERQLALLDAEPSLAACGTGVRYVPEPCVRDGARRYERWINSLVTAEQIERDIFVECPIPHPTLCARRTVLADIEGYHDTDWPEDYDLVLRLWAAGKRVAKVPAVLLDWREGEGRLSRTDARYGEDAFRRCKVHFLARTLLRGHDRVIVWGAGPVGKAFARELVRQGFTIDAFVDLDPRKIGQIIHDAPVIAPPAIHQRQGRFTVAAVGSDDARAEIRAALDQAGWREMHDFCAVA